MSLKNVESDHNKWVYLDDDLNIAISDFKNTFHLSVKYQRQILFRIN